MRRELGRRSLGNESIYLALILAELATKSLAKKKLCEMMYFSIVVSLHFCWWEFILGTTIGAICIATALGTCLWCSPRLADRVASLPLVPVVVIMAIYIAVQAFVPAMNPSPRNSAGAC